MLVKITSKRQVTFPARVLDAMGVGPGGPAGTGRERPTDSSFARRRIDVAMLGGLRDKIPPDHPPFDIDKFREEGYDPALRD